MSAGLWFKMSPGFEYSARVAADRTHAGLRSSVGRSAGRSPPLADLLPTFAGCGPPRARGVDVKRGLWMVQSFRRSALRRAGVHDSVVGTVPRRVSPPKPSFHDSVRGRMKYILLRRGMIRCCFRSAGGTPCEFGGPELRIPVSRIHADHAAGGNWYHAGDPVRLSRLRSSRVSDARHAVDAQHTPARGPQLGLSAVYRCVRVPTSGNTLELYEIEADVSRFPTDLLEAQSACPNSGTLKTAPSISVVELIGCHAAV